MAPDPEALEEWMESVMNIFLELFQRLETQRSTVVNAAQETQRKDVSQEALYAQIEKLQNSVQELQCRESELKRKLLIQGISFVVCVGNLSLYIALVVY